MLTRKKIEEEESLILAPYAVKSKDTKGRVHKEKEHDYRSAYQRDKDRVIYSTAFRRLEYKTQVFVNHEGDHYRTRLTHTLEVSQIARAIARALRLNAELVEAIALAHDVGHTPFGHSGEDTLRELLKDHGGFNHNAQGLRTVDFLEKMYPSFDGLNLTYEVREGIIKHTTSFDVPEPSSSFGKNPQPSLEAQVVDVADEIAYDNHDLDDGLASGLLKSDALDGIAVWDNIAEIVTKEYPKIDRKIKRSQIIRTLINLQVTDVIKNTEERINKLKIESVEDARKHQEKIVGFSDDVNVLRKPLREFLVKNLYNHYRVIRMSEKAYRIMRDLFEVYTKRPEQLPPSQSVKLKKEDKYSVVRDYIAGMTDRYAQAEYEKFFDPYKKV